MPRDPKITPITRHEPRTFFTTLPSSTTDRKPTRRPSSTDATMREVVIADYDNDPAVVESDFASEV